MPNNQPPTRGRAHLYLLAIAGDRMLVSFQRRIYAMRYAKLPPRRQYRHAKETNFGQSLDVMFISMHISVCTHDNEPPTVQDVADYLYLPYNSTKACMDYLLEHKVIKLVPGRRKYPRYASDLTRLNSYMTSRQHLAVSIAELSTCLSTLLVLQAELNPYMDD